VSNVIEDGKKMIFDDSYWIFIAFALAPIIIAIDIFRWGVVFTIVTIFGFTS